MSVYNDCFDSNILPLSMRRSIISLIHKKGDKTYRNYRPISLTNTDYRILTFVLANRLQKVIKDIASHDQVAYIKDRFTGTNMRLVLDFSYIIAKMIEDYLCLWIFKKAFDSAEWELWFKTLDKFNFGHDFQKWIKLNVRIMGAYQKNSICTVVFVRDAYKCLTVHIVHGSFIMLFETEYGH